ncbi:MAG: hemolysin family protein [Saprospiraceae bacterium]
MTTDIIITFILVFMNGFFVAAEFAIVKVRSSQLELKVQAGNHAAKLAKHIVTHLDGYLAATQLGITLASLGLGWIGEPVVSKIIINLMHFTGLKIQPELAHDLALPVAFAIITILHIVFGELAPKSIAIQRAERTTLFITYPLQFFYLLFKPFIWVLNGVATFLLKLLGIHPVHGAEVHSSDELKYLVQQGRESGAIEEDNYDIIKNAFDFSGRSVKQTMVPRNQLSAIDLNDYKESDLEKLIVENYSRIPCFEDNLDIIVGIAYLKDILVKLRKNESINIRELMRPVMTVPESKRIGRLLKEFQLKHQQLAVVVSEYGVTVGIITMENILEELVGEIQDEFDNESLIVEKISDRIFNVIASASLDDINKLLPHPIIKEGKYETLAGWLLFNFGSIPNMNEKITVNRYEITITKKSKNTIALAQLRDIS